MLNVKGSQMPTVFLSYSTKDHHFAELAGIKLAEKGITLWRDQGQLRAGSEWRGAIERGISDSIAVVVALSENSAESSYVTFEWAYGLGKGKTVVPLRLEACKIHPRLEPIQYLDFSSPRLAAVGSTDRAHPRNRGLRHIAGRLGCRDCCRGTSSAESDGECHP